MLCIAPAPPWGLALARYRVLESSAVMCCYFSQYYCRGTDVCGREVLPRLCSGDAEYKLWANARLSFRRKVVFSCVVRFAVDIPYTSTCVERQFKHSIGGLSVRYFHGPPIHHGPAWSMQARNVDHDTCICMCS